MEASECFIMTSPSSFCYEAVPSCYFRKMLPNLRAQCLCIAPEKVAKSESQNRVFQGLWFNAYFKANLKFFCFFFKAKHNTIKYEVRLISAVMPVSGNRELNRIVLMCKCPILLQREWIPVPEMLFFSVLMLCLWEERRSFIAMCYSWGANVWAGKESMGICWLVEERWAGFICCQTVSVCNFL